MGTCHVGCDDLWPRLLCSRSNGHKPFLSAVWQACSCGQTYVNVRMSQPSVAVAAKTVMKATALKDCSGVLYKQTQMTFRLCTSNAASKLQCAHCWAGQCNIVDLFQASYQLGMLPNWECVHGSTSTAFNTVDKLRTCYGVQWLRYVQYLC